MPRRKQLDTAILEAALAGLESQRLRVEEQITTVRRMIGGRVAKQAPAPPPAAIKPRKRTMSAAGRKRIAEAQRKRWAELKRRAAAAKKVRPKAVRTAATRTSKAAQAQA